MNHLIDNWNAWDAVRIIVDAKQQVWEETLAVVWPEGDDTREVVPEVHVTAVQTNPAYRLLGRIERRIMDAWRNGEIPAEIA